LSTSAFLEEAHQAPPKTICVPIAQGSHSETTSWPSPAPPEKVEAPLSWVIVIKRSAPGAPNPATVSKLPKHSMKSQMVCIDLVPSGNRQPSRQPDQFQCVCNPKGTVIEKNMMIRAETQEVRQVIGTIVRPT
jgi:hypothetical protein